MNKDTVIIILAAGKGSRLKSIFEEPKPLVKVLNSYRLIDFTIDNVINSNLVDDCFIIGRSKTLSLKEYLEKNDDSIFDDKINYNGTIDTLIKNINLFNNSYKNVLILYSDQVYNLDYNDLIKYHNSSNSDVTIIYKLLLKDQLRNCASIELDNDKLKSFKEKDEVNSNGLGSLGLFIFNKEVLVNNLSNKFIDIAKDFIPSLLKKYRIYGYKLDGFWFDYGISETFFEGEKLLKYYLKVDHNFKLPKEAE